MSEVWRKAKAYLDSLEDLPHVVKVAKFEKASNKGRFSQGDFKVDFFVKVHERYPTILGMNKYTPIDEKKYEKILSFVKNRNLSIIESDIGFYFIDPTGRFGGVFTPCFAASEPELFEAIGKEIYNLRTKKEVLPLRKLIGK
jgi:hypothetical protein